jgi:hypothetical protein
MANAMNNTILPALLLFEGMISLCLFAASGQFWMLL